LVELSGLRVAALLEKTIAVGICLTNPKIMV